MRRGRDGAGETGGGGGGGGSEWEGGHKDLVLWQPDCDDGDASQHHKIRWSELRLNKPKTTVWHSGQWSKESMTLKTDMMQKPFWQKKTDWHYQVSFFICKLYIRTAIFSGQASVSMQNWDTDHV